MYVMTVDQLKVRRQFEALGTVAAVSVSAAVAETRPEKRPGPRVDNASCISGSGGYWLCRMYPGSRGSLSSIFNTSTVPLME
jgi:hypothetical protein